MFVKIGEDAIISIAEIVSVTKEFCGEFLRINLKNTENGSIDIRGEGNTKANRVADVNRIYNFVWEAICEYRKTQPDFEGVKKYLL